jgi:hypothetical protein
VRTHEAVLGVEVESPETGAGEQLISFAAAVEGTPQPSPSRPHGKEATSPATAVSPKTDFRSRSRRIVFEAAGTWGADRSNHAGQDGNKLLTVAADVVATLVVVVVVVVVVDVSFVVCVAACLGARGVGGGGRSVG